jgi:hypothetical protein
MAVTASFPLLVVMAATEAVAAAAEAVVGECIVGVGAGVDVVAVVGMVDRLAVTEVVTMQVRDMRKRQHPTWRRREAATVGSRPDAGTTRAP